MKIISSTSMSLLILSVFCSLMLFSCNMQPKENNNIPHPQPATIDTSVVLPPSWAFGIIYGAYSNQEETIQLIDEMIARDYPIDAYWIDSWIWDWQNQGVGPKKYMDFVADTISYPDMQGMWDYMKERNIKSGMWMWDCILKTGNEEVYEDFRSKGFFSREFIRTDTWHNGGKTTIIGDNSETVEGTWCGDINFDDPEAVEYFRSKTKHFFDKGLDFIKLDRTDDISVLEVMFELSQDFGKETNGRGFMFSHSGTKDENYKKFPAKWTDDTRSDWSAKTHTREFSPWLPGVGFKENIFKYTNPENQSHKIPFLANDMGGFAVSTDGFVDEELYIRWSEFAVFVPLTTPFAQPENPSRNFAFLVSERADSIFRNYAQMKMKLFPYIYTYAHKSRLDGVNTIRLIPGHPYQYLFGESYLVAPVYEQGQKQRAVFLPEGNSWVNYYSGETFSGGQTIMVDTPIDQIPLFVKQGSIIPQRKYARSIESGTNDLLELHIYPGKAGQFTLIEDDGSSNDYLKGIYAKTEMLLDVEENSLALEVLPVSGFYESMKEDRKWEVMVFTEKQPSSVKLNGKTISFDAKDGKVFIPAFEMNKSKGWALKILF